MKKYKNNYVRIISILLILCTLCGTASATDISSITATSSPIEVLVDNSTASFVLKNNDSEYYKYALEIMNTDDETYLLCDTFEANETAKLANIKTDTEYPVWLEVYSETDVLFYDGSFVVDTSNVTSVSLTKVKTKTNTEKMSEEDIESLFQMTDEQYENLFTSLDIPSFISEEEAKAKKHVKRLEEYEDSYDKIGYKNADGTNTLYIFSSPVKYMDENGELQDADPNISETTGTEKSEGYSFVNDYGELKTYFADSLSNDKGIKIKKNDIEFEFGFTVKEKKENALTKLTSKVKNIFSKPDNKATVFSNNREKKLEYAKVENGIDIVSLPTTNGAVQTLILDDVPENNKLTFWVESNGLTPELDLYNKNVLFSTENDYVFSVGNVEIEDSATEDQIQSGLHFSTDNTVKILNNQNGRSLVEVSLDEDVLTSPTTVYPVSVTLSAAANETNSTESENSSITTLSTTSAPSEIGSSYFQDRTVYTNDSEDPANSPYLIIGDNNYYTGGYYDDSNCTYVAPGYVYRKGHVFMKYDVSSLTNIDPKLVDDAQLVLREGSGNNSELEVDLYRVTKPWTESTVDISYVYECDNQYSGNNDIVFADSGTGIEYEIDVAHMLTDNLLYSQGKDGGVPNYGFHLFTNNLYTSVSKHICSSEHSNIYYRPKVVISYDDPFPLTLGYETAHGYINAADPSDWYSFTPSETGLYDFFTTSDVDTYGQLFDSSFNLLIADDDSGEENNFNITYNLTAGQTYYIRVRGLNYGDTGFYFIKVGQTNGIYQVDALKTQSGNLIAYVTTLNSGEKYFQMYAPESDEWSDLFDLSTDTINLLTNMYNANDYNVVAAKIQLDEQYIPQGVWNVEAGSDMYYGLWLYGYLIFEHYTDSCIFLAKIGVTTQIVVSNVNQWLLTVNSLFESGGVLFTIDQNLYFYCRNSYEAFSTLDDLQAIAEGITDTINYVANRPHWKESEVYCARYYPDNDGFKYNQSYKIVDGELVECAYGTPGSWRPDYIKYDSTTDKYVIGEVKNYTITTSAGRNNLANNIYNQYNDRVNRLSSINKSVEIEFRVDVRGQDYTQDMLDDITDRVTDLTKKTNLIKFIY